MSMSTGQHAIKTVVDGEKRTAIMDAISSYDVHESASWDALDQLSSHTDFEEIDAVPDGIFEISKNDFKAIATVYVTLRYGDRNDQTSMSDSYPVHVEGTYDAEAGTASITKLFIDTSSFYR